MSTMTTTVTNNKKKNKKAKASSSSDGTVATSSKSNIAIIETILGTQVWKGTTGGKKMTKVSLAESIQNTEFVGLYFGAQSSRVSTAFTPRLIDFYNQVNESGSNKKNNNTNPTLEICYVSGDQTQEEFDTHFGTMPWMSVVGDTYDTLKTKNDLVPLFKAFRVPCMVILHVPTGQFVTEHAVKHINSCFGNGKEEKAQNVSQIIDQWRNTNTQSIQDAHKMLDYGGGTMSILLFLYQNPYFLCGVLAILFFSPLGKALWKKPMVMVGFLFIFKKYLTPKGDQNMPGVMVFEQEQDATLQADESDDNNNNNNSKNETKKAK